MPEHVTRVPRLPLMHNWVPIPRRRVHGEDIKHEVFAHKVIRRRDLLRGKLPILFVAESDSPIAYWMAWGPTAEHEIKRRTEPPEEDA